MHPLSLMDCSPGQVLSGGVCLGKGGWPAGPIQQRTQQILNESQFHPHHASLTTRIADWFGRLIDRVVSDSFSGGILTDLIVMAAVLIVVVAVVLGTRFAAKVKQDPGAEEAAVRRVRRSPVEWSAEAAVHEAAGEWRDALRCRYRALVAELALRGLVEEVPGRTTREYEAQVHHNLPLASQDFDIVTDIFEAAWYGNVPSGPEEGTRFKSLASSVVSEAARR